MSDALLAISPMIEFPESGTELTTTSYSKYVSQTFEQSGVKSISLWTISIPAFALACRIIIPSTTIRFTNSDRCSIINSTWGISISGATSESVSARAASTTSTSVVIPAIDKTFSVTSDSTLSIVANCSPTSGYSGQTITWTNQLITAQFKQIQVSI